ncbi:hypothetical protein DPMN_130371 [Dreissena polymorpha]|uniref:Uncharacterized protein n=1 Tax=Dreissena polymorpha TaxID=45954 RepID=A0A9D4K1A0_DREPO|nr:hypothetical protein DPMN_130371 [Dreissena polymorpha]
MNHMPLVTLAATYFMTLICYPCHQTTTITAGTALFTWQLALRNMVLSYRMTHTQAVY